MRGLGNEAIEAKRVAKLMTERHSFEPLDRDMIEEVAVFIRMAALSYNRLDVYNPGSAKEIIQTTAYLKAHLQAAWRALFEQKSGKEIIFRMSQRKRRRNLKSGRARNVDLTSQLESTLSQSLSLLAERHHFEDQEAIEDNDPTWPFTSNVNGIRCDFEKEFDVDDLKFNDDVKNFPNNNQWLSGYALPIVYFTTYLKNRSGGSAPDDSDKVGPMYTFVRELFIFISGKTIRGDTIQKNKRRLLDPRIHWKQTAQVSGSC